MAISSYKTYLMHKASGATQYTKLIDIKSTPDGIMGSPNMLETTTLSDPQQTFIEGIRQVDSSGFEFTANYTKTDFTTVNALKGVDHDYAVWFGATTNTSGVDTPTGSEGQFSFKGLINASPKGVGVDEVVEMTITIAPTTAVSFTTPA